MGSVPSNVSVEKRPSIYKIKRGAKLVVYQSLPRFTKIGVFGQESKWRKVMHSNAKKGFTHRFKKRSPRQVEVHHSTSKYINIMVLLDCGIPKHTKEYQNHRSGNPHWGLPKSTKVYQFWRFFPASSIVLSLTNPIITNRLIGDIWGTKLSGVEFTFAARPGNNQQIPN
jgi:hypothetical protein